MPNITIEIVTDGNIEQCRALCNELMAFQQSKATIAPEAFDNMTFEGRLKASFDHALRSHLVVVKDGDIPVGYVFSTLDEVSENDVLAIPSWAPVSKGEKTIGMYPHWDNLPSKVGCLSQLYFRDEYRGLGLGGKLFDMAMSWLENDAECDLAFVYISNGNDAAYDFYLHKGFVYSHDVFGGFIKAAYYDFKHKKEISTMNTNYNIMNIGSFTKDLAEKKRVMAGETLGLTGSEISFNHLPAGESSPFVHSHKLNEEVYVIINGNGKFMVDENEFAVEEGSVIQVAPQGERALFAGSDGLTYICIQTQANSLTQATHDDGVVTDTKASWMKK